LYNSYLNYKIISWWYKGNCVETTEANTSKDKKKSFNVDDYQAAALTHL